MPETDVALVLLRVKIRDSAFRDPAGLASTFDADAEVGSLSGSSMLWLTAKGSIGI